MANKRRADPAARPARRLRNDDRTLSEPFLSTETIIRFYLHPPLPLPTPLTGNVIAGGSFARPSEVLRLVSYLEGNIVRGLPGPVNRLLTLWDVDREEMTGYRDTFPHVVQIYTERFLGRPWFRGDKGYVLWLRFCLIIRWMEWVDLLWISRKFENFVNNCLKHW